MSEFFLELFSEEIPSNLQQNLREDLLKSFNDLFLEKSILFKKSSSYSTPNRLVVLFEGVQKNVVLKSEEIKGPNIKSPEVALEGFVRSNKIVKKDLYQKKTDKGEFYFFKTKSKKLHTHELLEEFIPILLNKIQWKKSMYWGTFDLNWGRPLKSILAVFDKKKLNFNFHHLTSSNSTFIDKEFEENKKSFLEFKNYKSFFKKMDILIDHNDRKNLILFRGKFSFIIMNLYPYNNGHLMVCPYKHIASLSKLNEETLSEIMKLISKSSEILKKTLNAEGFNIGANIGSVGGAGIDDHLHFHLVPRWKGDTNFMPCLLYTSDAADE